MAVVINQGILDDSNGLVRKPGEMHPTWSIVPTKGLQNTVVFVNSTHCDCATLG